MCRAGYVYSGIKERTKKMCPEEKGDSPGLLKRGRVEKAIDSGRRKKGRE